MMARFSLLALPLILAACGGPERVCINDANASYAAFEAELAEARAEVAADGGQSALDRLAQLEAERSRAVDVRDERIEACQRR